MSSLSTILNHLPSWGPTQTQGSRWGAGKVHFLSNGSQSGPMPASAATGSSHFMLLLQSFCRLSDVAASHARQRGRLYGCRQSWSLRGVNESECKLSVGSPGARARCGCSLRQLCELFVRHGQNFFSAASVFMPLASFVALAFFCAVWLDLR